jgi:hypothetical protein
MRVAVNYSVSVKFKVKTISDPDAFVGFMGVAVNYSVSVKFKVKTISDPDA